jgi:hypothetical protein
VPRRPKDADAREWQRSAFVAPFGHYRISFGTARKESGDIIEVVVARLRPVGFSLLQTELRGHNHE